MAIAPSRLAFKDCFDLFDRAMADDNGIRIKFTYKGDAEHFRLRLHKARRLDRDDNFQTYDEGHPLYGRSIYDPIVCRVIEADDNIWLNLEKRSAAEFEVESLSEPEEEEDVLDEANSSDS